MNPIASSSHMITVQCQYLNHRFEICLDPETHEALMNDEEQLNNYVKMVYEANIKPTEPDTPHTETEENRESDSQTESKLQWTRAAVILLIETRLIREAEFNRPACKKKKLWQQIAHEINTKLHMKVTSVDCDLKFRNLLKTYKNNKKRQQTSGEGAITWEFFERFDNILGCKAAINPPEGALYDTLQNENVDLVNQEPPEPEPFEEPPSSPSTSSDIQNKGKRGTKRKLQISDYLYKKLELDELRIKRKEEFELQKWKEEKELKEKEINAILKLVKVLAPKTDQ